MRDWNEDESEEEEEVHHAHHQVPEGFKAKAEETYPEGGEEEQNYPEVLAATGEEPDLESPAITGEKGASGVIQGEERQERRRYDDTDRGGRGGYRGRGGFRGNNNYRGSGYQ